MRATAVILGVECVDSDVDQMEDNFTAVHVSVRILRTTWTQGYVSVVKPCKIM